MSVPTKGGRRIVTPGPKRLVADEWLTTTGSSFEWVYLDSPASVVIAGMTTDGGIVLLRQFRPTLQRSVLELPGGLVGPSEDPADAALRELLEETGYGVDDPRHVEHLGSFYCMPSETNRVVHYFLMRNVKLHAPPSLDTETEISLDLSVQVIPLLKVIQEIGETIDSLESCFALMHLVPKSLG